MDEGGRPVTVPSVMTIGIVLTTGVVPFPEALISGDPIRSCAVGSCGSSDPRPVIYVSR